MGSFSGRYCLDGIDTELVVDHLHLLCFLYSNRPGVEPQKNTVLDGDLASPLNSDAAWRQVSEGGGLQQEVLDILYSNLKSQNIKTYIIQDSFNSG